MLLITLIDTTHERRPWLTFRAASVVTGGTTLIRGVPHDQGLALPPGMTPANIPPSIAGLIRLIRQGSEIIVSSDWYISVYSATTPTP